MREGSVYQAKGPFTAGENAIASVIKEAGSAGKVRIGISIDTKDWLPLSDGEGFTFTITGTGDPVTIQMGRTCMYESEDGLYVDSITFNKDAPVSTIINLIGC